MSGYEMLGPETWAERKALVARAAGGDECTFGLGCTSGGWSAVTYMFNAVSHHLFLSSERCHPYLSHICCLGHRL